MDKDFKEVTAKITHPNGVDMKFSESLTEFLISREDKSVQFLIGHWIESLPNDQLGRLMQFVDEYFHGGDAPYLDDIFSLIIIAVPVERNERTISVTPENVHEWCSALLLATGLEINRRHGYVEILNPMGIDTKTNTSIRITELGRQAGEEMKLKHWLH